MLSPADLSRRHLIALLLGAVAVPLLPDRGVAEALARTPLPPARRVGRAALTPAPATSADALVAAAQLGGVVGYVVADARTGTVLEGANGALALPPASVAKTMTSLYALDLLGPGFRFDTRLIGTGAVIGGVVQGDLILAGSGDPTLATDDLAAMAKALKAKGITGITGRFLVWSGALPDIAEIDRGQPDHVGYNPAISGLNLNFNRVYFEWRKTGADYAISMDARSDLYRPAVAMARMQVVNRQSPLYTYASAEGRDDWTVARPALGTSGSRWLPVRHPALYAGQVFQAMAAAQGIRLPAPKITAAVPPGSALVSHASADLATILRDMLKYSTNITAEVVGLTASRAGGVKAASLAASAAAMNRWLGQTHGLRSAAFVDHSGLGGDTRIAAADLVTALLHPAGKTTLRGLMKQVPLVDAKGREVVDHPVRITAKTGTLNFVSGLAGFATAKDGTDLVFAILCADVARRDRVPMADREQPDGGQAWTRRARRLQQGLIAHWSGLYGG